MLGRMAHAYNSSDEDTRIPGAHQPPSLAYLTNPRPMIQAITPFSRKKIKVKTMAVSVHKPLPLSLMEHASCFTPLSLLYKNPRTLQMSLLLVSSPVIIPSNAPEENQTSFTCHYFTILLSMPLFNFLSHFLQF